MPEIDFRAIFAPRHRGILLDLVVFVFNLILLTLLPAWLAGLAQKNKAGVGTAQKATALFCLALVFLQPTGAILKRWRAHQRSPQLQPAAGCWIPFYFLSQLMFLIYASVLLIQAGGEDYQFSTWLTASLLIGIPALAVANTFLVADYFATPIREPRWKFLMSPRAELLGDLCVFLGMIFYQTLWIFLMTAPRESFERQQTLSTRIFLLGFTVVFVYLPSRILYLAEDLKRPLSWLTMLLANLPVMLRFLSS